MARLWLAVLATIVSFVAADQTITVDGADLQIRYTTVNPVNQTWQPVARSTASCDTPQMLTSNIGDYMTFTFTGTGVQVIGTIGNKRGNISFTLDGVDVGTFDRSHQGLICDATLFQKGGLTYEQHTIVGTLIGGAADYSSGLWDPVLSVQRIRYTIPGGGGGGSNVGAIAGGAAGGAVFAILVAVLIFMYIRRKRHRRASINRVSRASFDGEDIPPHLQGGGGFKSSTTSPGLIATPFEWKGPGQVYDSTPMQPTSPPAGSVSFAPTTSPYASGVPMPGYAHSTSGGPSQAGWEHSQNSTEPGKRESGALSNSSAAVGFGLANPEEGARRESTSSPPHDQLVDRIANRLADIIHTRAGGAQVLDSIVPPPEYRPQYVSPNEAISNLREQALQDRARSSTPTTMLPYAQNQSHDDPRASYTSGPGPSGSGRM